MKTTIKETTTPMKNATHTDMLTNNELQATIDAAEQLRAETIYLASASAFRFLGQAIARLFDVEYKRHA
jgi:hypothetical protein